MIELTEDNMRIVMDREIVLSRKLFALSWMNSKLFEPLQELGRLAEALESIDKVAREMWSYRENDGWDDGWCSLSFPGSLIKEIDELLG